MPENAKVITTEALIGKFRQALNEKWGYIWGTSGENWTAAKQKELEKTTDADRAQGRQYGSKWIGHTVAAAAFFHGRSGNSEAICIMAPIPCTGSTA